MLDDLTDLVKPENIHTCPVAIPRATAGSNAGRHSCPLQIARLKCTRLPGYSLAIRLKVLDECFFAIRHFWIVLNVDFADILFDCFLGFQPCPTSICNWRLR